MLAWDTERMAVRIRQVLASFGWWQWLLAGVFLLALLAAGLFAFRTVRYTLYWSQHHNDPIERWMTVNYVARSYDVPPEALWTALGLPPARPPSRDARRPLSAIATARGQTFEQVRATLEAAIADARAQPPALRPPPAPPPPRNDRGGP